MNPFLYLAKLHLSIFKGWFYRGQVREQYDGSEAQ